MPQIILTEKTAHLANYTFLQEMLINIKTYFHGSINHQEHLFRRTLITSYFRHVNIAKFLRTAFSIEYLQKQSFADVLQNRCSESFAKFMGKHLRQSLILKNFQAEDLQLYFKKRFQHRCFPVKLAKFLRTLFYKTPPVSASAPQVATSVFF